MPARQRPPPPRPMTPEQKKSNQRLGWILGAIAFLIFVGFIAKSALLGR